MRGRSQLFGGLDSAASISAFLSTAAIDSYTVRHSTEFGAQTESFKKW